MPLRDVEINSHSTHSGNLDPSLQPNLGEFLSRILGPWGLAHLFFWPGYTLFVVSATGRNPGEVGTASVVVVWSVSVFTGSVTVLVVLR